jgi:hypothetical protein
MYKVYQRKYTTLYDTLKDLKKQVKASYKFAESYIPDWVQTPSDLFDLLKANTEYEKDPPKNELLQKMETLLGSNNYHGMPGLGDCDCFTIAALASFKAIGIKNPVVILAGKTKKSPGHIYAGYIDNGKYVPFDLTNETFGYERYYPYKQVLRFTY